MYSYKTWITGCIGESVRWRRREGLQRGTRELREGDVFISFIGVMVSC